MSDWQVTSLCGNSETQIPSTLELPDGETRDIMPRSFYGMPRSNTHNFHLIFIGIYAGQEATVRTGHGTTDWFQIGKEYVKVVYCHPAYLTSMQSTS